MLRCTQVPEHDGSWYIRLLHTPLTSKVKQALLVVNPVKLHLTALKRCPLTDGNESLEIFVQKSQVDLHFIGGQQIINTDAHAFFASTDYGVFFGKGLVQIGFPSLCQCSKKNLHFYRVNDRFYKSLATLDIGKKIDIWKNSLLNTVLTLNLGIAPFSLYKHVSC